MPDWKSLVQERIAALSPEAAQTNLAEEVALHLEDYYRELLSGGATEEEAWQSAISELDDMYPLREELDRIERMTKHDAVPAGDARRASFLEDLWRDVRYALRTAQKSPTFVLFVVVTLSLGIGANSTVFTVINTLILSPLPVRNANELAAVAASEVHRTSTSGMTFSNLLPGFDGLPSQEQRFPLARRLHLSAGCDVARGRRFGGNVHRAGHRQLLLDAGTDAGQRTLLRAGGGQYSGHARRCRHESR